MENTKASAPADSGTSATTLEKQKTKPTKKKGCCSCCRRCCKCKACLKGMWAFYTSFYYAFIMTFVLGTASEVASLYTVIRILASEDTQTNRLVFASFLVTSICAEEIYAIRNGIRKKQYFPYADRSLAVKLFTLYQQRCYDATDKTADTHEDSRVTLILWYMLEIPLILSNFLLALYADGNIWLQLMGFINGGFMLLQTTIRILIEIVCIPVRGSKIKRRSSSVGVATASSAEQCAPAGDEDRLDDHADHADEENAASSVAMCLQSAAASATSGTEPEPEV